MKYSCFLGLILFFVEFCSAIVRQRCTTGHFNAESEPVVSTHNGKVLGLKETKIDPRQNKSISWTSYFDIPYAEPPIGDLRFRAPVSLRGWSWDCVREGRRSEERICPQVSAKFSLDTGLVILDEKSDEDCLLLNVYVPEVAEPGLLPVLVWIHGGGYTGGDGTSQKFGPLYYMAHDVILVTIRYRLSTLGFLSLGSEEVPGNAGVRDQVMALTWVQENIREFGGDPDLVTINGQSAGSFASTYHIASPLTRGLFKRAILQSGAGGFSPSYHHFSEARAIKYGELAAIEAGCWSLSLEAVFECLRSRPVINLLALELANELMAHPSIDGGHTDQPYMATSPEEVISQGHYDTDLDIMIGITEDESLIGTQIFLPAPDLFAVVRDLWPIAGPYALLQRHTSEITEEDVELATSILEYYCGSLEQLDSSQFDNFTKMTSDSFFFFGVHKFLSLHTQNSKGNTYFYRDKYVGEHHNVWAPGLHEDDIHGVGHSDELYLQWDHKDGEDYSLNAEDSRISLAMTTMWSNFVKYGNPTPEADEVGVRWEPVTSEDYRFLVIDAEMKMDMDDDYLERMAFWESLNLDLSGS